MNIQRIYEGRKHFDRKENFAGVTMGIIPVLGFLIFGLIPMVLGIVMSFFNFDKNELFFKFGSKQNFEFCGLDNYICLFKSPKSEIFNKDYMVSGNGYYFVGSLLTTLMMLITSVPIGITLSLLVAYFLTKKIKGKDLMRTVYLIPFICSSVAVSLIWGLIFAKNGVINEIWTNISGVEQDKAWTRESFYTVVFIINLWGGTGFNIILLTAALTNVNNSYYEAAKVDGANAVTIFFKITLPCVSPTLFYLLITSLIGAFQAYAVPDMLVKKFGLEAGGTGTVFGYEVAERQTTVIGYLQYMLNTQRRPGMASAIGVVLAMVIGIVTIFNFIGSKYWVNYD